MLTRKHLGTQRHELLDSAIGLCRFCTVRGLTTAINCLDSDAMGNVSHDTKNKDADLPDGLLYDFGIDSISGRHRKGEQSS